MSPRRRHDITIGAMVGGREIVAHGGGRVTLRCACGRDTEVRRYSLGEAAKANRCRTCGYADMKTGHRENAGNTDGRHPMRTAICRLVVEQFGPANAEARDIESDPVVSCALDFFERYDLGGMPFTSNETGILLGLSRAGVGVIEERALAKMRVGLSSVAEGVVDALRERDADRDPWMRVS